VQWLQNRQDGSGILRLQLTRIDCSVACELWNHQLLTVQKPQNTGTVLTVLLFYGYGTINSRFINSFMKWQQIT